MAEFINHNPITSSIIMVAGIGGGGGNAVNHLYRLGTADVTFLVCNTDSQALDRSPVPNKIMFGNGLGAGNKPERARQAAMDSVDEIKEMFEVNKTKMLFATAGMGGGTGTGAAPIVARVAKDMGILTVGIVSIPFIAEGPARVTQAIYGIDELSHCVDSMIVINNQSIEQMHGTLGIKDALAKADDVLAMAAKSIADIITGYTEVNVDFADVTTVMSDSGVALMGSATGSGENRALEVAQRAIDSPLLHHNTIFGAKNVLLNLSWGEDQITYSESTQILQFIQQQAGLGETDIIWGAGVDPTLGKDIRVTVVATGFDVRSLPDIKAFYDRQFPRTSQGAVNSGGRNVVPLDGEPSNRVADVAKPKSSIADADGFAVFERGSTDSTSQNPTYGGINSGRGAEINSQKAAAVRKEYTDYQYIRSVGATIDTESAIDTMVAVEESTVDVPAWRRRGADLYSVPRDASMRREVLEPSGSRSSDGSTKSEGSLFNQ